MFSDENTNETSANSDTVTKIREIINAEFSREIENKKNEILEIYKSLNKATKYLHYLRYSIVNNYYTRPELYDEEVVALSKQIRIHPALVYTTGEESLFPKSGTDINLSNCSKDLTSNQKRKRDDHDENKNKKLKNSDLNDNKSSKEVIVKAKKRICIKNISQWIVEEFREKNKATHKWTIVVMDDETKKVPEFLSKVRYFLHESYEPHNIVDVTSAPFSLCRFGWGEFPVRVQLHFVNNLHRPVDIIHNLKLDTKCTGLPTYSGGETKFDLFIHTNEKNLSVSKELKNENNILSNDEDTATDNIQNNFTDKENEINLNDKKSEEIISSTIHSLFNDHDYAGSYIKNYQNGKINNHHKKLQESQVNCNSYANEDKSLKLDVCEQFENGSSYNLPCTFSNKVSNGHDFGNSNQILNVENTDIFDKRIYRYNCAMIQKEYSKILVNLVQLAQLKTPFDMFKFIIRRLPLITEKATDPCYRMLHPYATESFQVFNNYSVGKQRSLEWYRAKHALKILKSAGCSISDHSIKDFIICARKYCYTPILIQKYLPKNVTLMQSEDKAGDYIEHVKTSTNLNSVDEWLNFIEDNKIYKNFKAEEEIDVLNIPLEKSNLNAEKVEKNKNSVNPVEILEIEDDLNEFIFLSLEKYGFKLENEEIIPGVSHCSASVLMVKAIKCLMEDLLRTSFSCARNKCKLDDFELEINQKSVCDALLKKEEFKYFTNKYLGSHR